MAAFRFVEWLLLWLLETDVIEFQWDTGNRSKNRVKHDISTLEVEEVFILGLAIPLGIQIRPAVEEERLGLVGPTKAGRVLQVVFTLREGKVRPISARPASKKERKEYGETLRKISERI